MQLATEDMLEPRDQLEHREVERFRLDRTGCRRALRPAEAVREVELDELAKALAGSVRQRNRSHRPRCEAGAAWQGRPDRRV